MDKRQIYTPAGSFDWSVRPPPGTSASATPPNPNSLRWGPIQYVVTSMDNAALARLVTTFKSSDHEAAG